MIAPEMIVALACMGLSMVILFAGAWLAITATYDRQHDETENQVR